MDAAVCNPSLGPSSSSSRYVSSRPSFCPDLRRSSVRLSSEVFKVKIGRLERSLCRSSGNKLSAVIASASQTSVSDPISTPSRNDLSDSLKKSNEASLILIRHGESLWNEKNLFTGSVDVPLTKKGVEEAIQAGKRISNIPVDMIYTSSLIRAQMTAMLAMTEHRQQKVPIILHDENERARTWGRIFSEETKKQSIPVVTAWQLNERMYGELQGLNKQETVERYGKEQVHEWRRSYDIPPPNGESLAMCAQRAVTYFCDEIEPQLFIGKNVMIAAHGNSLRSIIMYLDKLTTQEVISLELSTGVPLLYIFKEGRFVRRGSPVGPTEAGVYAYTGLNKTGGYVKSSLRTVLKNSPPRPFDVLQYRNVMVGECAVGKFALQTNFLKKLAQYRQKLDEMSH